MRQHRFSILAHPLTAPLASALLAIILFAPVIGHGYVYDAMHIIQRDKRLADPWFGLKVWVSQWWSEGSLVPLSRPLTQFTFWLQTQLHGNELAEVGQSTVNWFLTVDLLLYAALCALVAHLTRRWLTILLSPWAWPVGQRAGVRASGDKSVPGTLKDRVPGTLLSPGVRGAQTTAYPYAIVASWFVGLAFAVHPVHTEVVASSVGRADTLALLFIIVGILLWLRWRCDAFTWRRAFVIGLCVLAGGLSKENGYLLAPMLVVIEIALRRGGGRPIFLRAAAQPRPRLDVPWRVVVVILAVVAVAVAQREVSKLSVEDMVISRPPDMDNPLVIATPAQRVVTPLKIFGQAVRLLSWPLIIEPRRDDPDLPPVRPADSPDYSPRMLMPTDQLSDPMVLLGLVVAAGWLIAVAISWRKRHPALGPLLVVPVAWAIPSNTLLIIGTIMGERLILPLSCFALIAVAGLVPWWRMKPLSRALTLILSALLVIELALATLLYLPAWRSNESLEAYAVSFHPLSGRFQGFWAITLLLHGMEHPEQRDTFFDQAEHHARLALEYWPRNDQPYSVLGVIEHHRGNEEAAQRYLQYGRRGSPQWNISDDYLAKIGQAEQQAALKKRADELQKQLDADPDNKSLQLQLAGVYLQLKDHIRAIRLYDKSVDIASETDFSVLEQYLDAALARGTGEQVRQLIRRQLELRPDQWSVLTDAALIMMFSGDDDLDEARQWLQRAAELSPGSAEPWAGLSLWYEIKGDKARAVEMLEQALQRSSREDPKWVHYQLRMEQLLERYQK